MDSLHLDQHISKNFNEDLELLRTNFLKMGGLVEQQLNNAVLAIVNGDSELADSVFETERSINQLEVDIDRECTEIIARRQPAASDLRLILMVIKAVRDLERMGDESVKIARMVSISTMESYQNHSFVELRHLAERVQKMVRGSLDTFARFDDKAAIEVMKEDQTIDQEYNSAMRQMVSFMMEDSRTITRSLNIIWALRALERVGDHARNICEHIVYLVKGKDIRHTPIEKLGDNSSAP